MNPEAEYQRRLEQLRKQEARLKVRDDRLAYTILVVILAAVASGVWLIFSKIHSLFWALIPVVLLITCAVIHSPLIRKLRNCRRAIAFYERGLERLKNQWIGKGQSGERFLDPSHPYARDLDLFGTGSVFELLCTARTRVGERTLASWLLSPACPGEICLRHAAVRDLQGRLDLREKLAVFGGELRSAKDPAVLAAWGEEMPWSVSPFSRAALMWLTALGLCAVFACVVWAIQYIALLVGESFDTSNHAVEVAWRIRYLAPFVATFNLGIAYKLRRHILKSVSSVEEAACDLPLLSAVLARLELETFAAPKLANLQAQLKSDGRLASRCVSKLSRRVDFLISRHSLMVQLFDFLTLWTLQSSLSIEAWRGRYGPSLRAWLTALGELEALSSLAGYAYEHADDAFPEFIEGPARFEAEGLAHPLIPENLAKRNDLKLGDEVRLLIISGPNMAGKSTFVRAVGTNAVLAQCGAPVRARCLRMSPLKVGASVCVLDSLRGGISRFYAEISRVKLIIDLTKGESPVLVLLDELLQGTNSRDRRIGAEAVLLSLSRKGAIGLITTHDLALAEIANSPTPRVANFHFEDRLEDGKLRFDYHLSPGIAQTSNALALMRSIGLEV